MTWYSIGDGELSDTGINMGPRTFGTQEIKRCVQEARLDHLCARKQCQPEEETIKPGALTCRESN